MTKIVQLAMPMPIPLAEELMRVVAGWHSHYCQVADCKVYLTAGGWLVHDTATAAEAEA